MYVIYCTVIYCLVFSFLLGVIKQFGDKMCGIPTQCVLKSTLDKSGRATLVNICLKVNAKLGGVNLIIPCR